MTTAILTEPMLMDPKVIQRESARQRANEVRIARADIKREIKAGLRDPRDVILDPPAIAHGMEVMDVLVAIPRVGKSAASKVLLGAARRDLKLGQMSAVTRERIVERMNKYVWFALPRDQV